jgi:SAM-dependent methyltransferase
VSPVVLTPHPAIGTPSAWVTRWAAWLPAGSTVLDLACGSGRHLRWLAARGLRVTGVDRDAQALAGLAELAQAHGPGAAPAPVELLHADVESGPWPLPERRFDAVVVTHYLWRPLWPLILDSVAPGGLLIYETFCAGHERLGRPARPDFLLQPGELLQVTPPRLVQRICARRAGPDASSAPPLPLDLLSGQPGGTGAR